MIDHSLVVEREKKLICFLQGVRVFQLRTPLGPLLVLHPQYVNELKSHTHVSFTKAMQKVPVMAFGNSVF